MEIHAIAIKLVVSLIYFGGKKFGLQGQITVLPPGHLDKHVLIKLNRWCCQTVSNCRRIRFTVIVISECNHD